MNASTLFRATYARNKAIIRNPDVFPNSDQFDPQLWLDKKYWIRTDLKFYLYGHGRRYVLYPLQIMMHHTCRLRYYMKRIPWYVLANDSLSIAFTLIIWSFRIFERFDTLTGRVY